jgi:hypothetical protein
LVVKQPGREVNNSPLSIAEVKNQWSYTTTPLSRGQRKFALFTRRLLFKATVL